MANIYFIENISEFFEASNELENKSLSDYEKDLLNDSCDEYRRTHPEEF